MAGFVGGGGGRGGGGLIAFWKAKGDCKGTQMNINFMTAHP